MLARLLIWTLFNFSRCCLTSFFIAYGKLCVPSATLHEINASSSFILNIDHKNPCEHLCVLYIILCTFTAQPLQNFCILSSHCYLLYSVIHLCFFVLRHPYILSLPVCILFVLISFLFVLLTPCLILESYLLSLFVCIWVMMSFWEFRILVKAQTYIVNTFNLNLVCCFLVFMPTIALLSEKAILQNFQISCKVRVCGFR